MAARPKQAQPEGYATIEIENGESIAMFLFVTAPDGVEHFITRLEPGDSANQFTPVGAVWSLRPEVQAKQYVAQAGENRFTTTQAVEDEQKPDLSTRKGRGGASITSGTTRP